MLDSRLPPSGAQGDDNEMPPHLSELLRPSLSRAAPPRSPYSQQTHFLSAFFGGPWAAMAMNLINSWRLGRLPRDAAWLLLGAAAMLGLDAWLLQTASGQALLVQADALVGRNALAIASRALALLLFLLGLLLHRREHQATDLMGLKRPNGLLPGIGLIVGGSVAETLWRAWLR